MNSCNNFSYQIKNGRCKGYFNIYQAKNGSIQLQMECCNTTLTKQQILDLNIDLFELIDYNHDDFLKFYEKEGK